MAGIDYGAIATKNGVKLPYQYLEDYHLLIEEIGVGFYKNTIHLINDTIYLNPEMENKRKKVLYLKYNNIKFKVKHMYAQRYMCTFTHNNNHYRVYFGYGVDYSYMEYLNKKGYYGITKKELKMLKRYNLV